MPTMKVMQVDSPGAPFKLVQREVPEPGAQEVRLKVEACGICHGDSIAKDGRFPGLKYPRVPGHEVVGTIEKMGSPALGWKVGQRVGVGWQGGHCGQCASCRSGDFDACEDSLTTGLSTDGGYAEKMIARADVLSSIPEELTSAAAAPLLCAGRTTFGALQGSGARPGDLVVIHGLGGLGHLALQFAVKSGFHTVVVSRGKEKEALARELGAHGYLDSTSCDAADELEKLGGARVILSTAPSGKAIASLIGGLGRDGRIVIVAGAGDPMQVSPMQLLGGRRSIGGWVGGSIDETIRFSQRFGVKAMIETFPLEKAAEAYERMLTAKVHFRAVLKVS